MEANITLEQAKERAPKWLWRKMEHTIELLQKAERLALTYDKEDGFYLAFSAGKDSQALYHMAELAGVKFKGHVSWTSVDPPQVIRFKRQYYPEVVEHKPKKSIYDLAIDRGILPSKRIRWCCADLKESAGDGKVTLIGIRKEESTRRAKRHEVEVSDKRFSGNLDEFEQWRKAEIAKKEERLIKKMKREGKKVNEDEFSLQRDNEVRCINGKDSILVSPIFHWTERDVWTFLNEVVRVPHCELYDQGYKRIGCILCPMSQHRQKVRELKDFPHVKRGWIRAIKAIRAGGIRERIYVVEPASQRSKGQLPQVRKRYSREDYYKASRWQRQVGEHQETPRRIFNGNRTDGDATCRSTIPPPRQERAVETQGIAKAPDNQTMGAHSATTNGSGTTGRITPEPLEQKMQLRDMVGFSDSPSANGVAGGAKPRTDRRRNRRKDFLMVDKRQGIFQMVCRRISANEIGL